MESLTLETRKLILSPTSSKRFAQFQLAKVLLAAKTYANDPQQGQIPVLTKPGNFSPPGACGKTWRARRVGSAKEFLETPDLAQLLVSLIPPSTDVPF
jgi:hypothetical protein